MSIFGGGGPTLHEIDKFSFDKIYKYLFDPKSLDETTFGENYKKLLIELRDYCDEHDLSLWKRSRFVGNIEMFLRQYFSKEAAKILWVKAKEALTHK